MNQTLVQIESVGAARRPFRLLLVGIAGTSRDILLSLPTLKTFVEQDDVVRRDCVIEVLHHKYILPALMAESCDAILHSILDFRPDAVGFSTYVWNIEAVGRIAASLRQLSPRTKIILGGPEVAARDLRAGRFDEFPVDYVVQGEGEIPLRQLLHYFVAPRSIELDEIPRISHRTETELSHNKSLGDVRAGLIEDISSNPSPFLTGEISLELLARSNMQVNVETQRGCNLRCSYCLYHADFPRIRYRDVQVVLQEMQYIYESGVKHCRITDANFLSDKDFAAAVLQGMIDRKLELSIFFELIPSFLDERIATLLGVYQALSPRNNIMVGVGLQSINMKALEAARRRISTRHFDRTYGLLVAAQVVVKTDVMLGLPHETMESYLRLVEYISEKVRFGANFLSLSLLRILPGTELDKIAREEGLVLDRRDSEHFVYETPTIPRREMVECLKLTTATFRLLHAPEKTGSGLREKYFQVKQELATTHVALLSHFVQFFTECLAGRTSDFVKDDFPNAEHYWCFDVHKEFPDAVLVEELERLREQGLPLAESAA